jgi:hypothetical protein
VLRPNLDELAGLPAAKSGPRSITEPADRVGELVVKGTCHICHDATQVTQRPTTVMSGVIPALASFPGGETGGDFVHKVKAGAQVPLSAGRRDLARTDAGVRLSHRGRSSVSLLLPDDLSATVGTP